MKPRIGIFAVLFCWLLANRAEAFFGLGRLREATKALGVATSFAPADWMIATTQLGFAPSRGIAGECCQALEQGAWYFDEVALSP